MNLLKPNRLKSVIFRLLIWVTAMTGGKLYANEIFAELTDMPQVESTFISGRIIGNSMMTIPEMKEMLGNGIYINSDFKAMYIYRCYSIDSVNKARKILSRYVNDDRDIELVMRTRQGSQEYMLYEERVPGKENSPRRSKMIIWNADAPNVCQVVVIDWDDSQDLTQLSRTTDPLRYFQIL